MTDYEIEQFPFDQRSLEYWAATDPKFRNWPVVYTLQDPAKVYVGESLNAASRMRQHLDSANKQGLRHAKVIVGERFNKSVCLDLESCLIRWFAGDGKFEVLNRNDGVIDADYFDRSTYQAMFDSIFEELRQLGLFSRPVREIENGDLFKLSPFKALTQDQAIAIEDILEGLFQDLQQERRSTILIQGDPGTGKTVVAIYLIKLLMDIRDADTTEPTDGDTMFSEFFVEGYPQLLQGFRVGLVIPQQSLRKSVQRVFTKTPGLHATMVLSPFDVGGSDQRWDLLIVDETHRLNQRVAQPAASLNTKFKEINERLFGADDLALTQLDWIRRQSDHQVFLLDADQAVRPAADLPPQRLQMLRASAQEQGRGYRLTSQLRVRGGTDYITHVRGLLSDSPPARARFADYEFAMYDDIAAMVAAIADREATFGLSRLLAGYAWPWRSKQDTSAYDIEIGSVQLRWNSTAVDWVNSAKAPEEVGSIHTIQGYDLNYAGVIIGPDLRWDPGSRRLRFDRDNYFDVRGKKNNAQLGLVYDDEDLLRFVRNIYAVLLTRGIRGTFVYACDEALREHLRPLIPAASSVG